MRTLHVSISPLTNKIYCGSVSKDGVTWLSNKTDVTGEACAAVALKAIAQNGELIVHEGGKPKYRITAEEIPHA